jgi:ribose transport system ATP-binding protein
LFEMRGIDKHFDAVVALKGASLTVEPGQIMALLGSNGSGKSTMVKILAGLVEPNNGDVLFDGKPVRICSGIDSRKLGVSTAFQDLSLVPTMSIIDNMILGNEPVTGIGLVDRKLAEDNVKALLERFQIECYPDDYVQSLKPSIQSMLEIAKAVSLKPRLLLLDEVTAALHQHEIEILFGILRQLRDEGVAMVYVTHRMNEIFKICDNATIMRSGETIASAPVSGLTLDQIVYYMTGQRPEVAEHEGIEEYNHPEDLVPVLEVSNLEIDPKVKDISLKAYKGEIIGIAGLEGQGQTEFIRTVLGATKKDSGEMYLGGKEMHYKSPADAVRNGIGFISGERNREAMFPDRPISENIFSGNAAKGKLFSYLNSRTVRDFAQNAVEKFNIKIGELRNPANSLSGGNQQKLVLARWIAMNPILLLLDDPTKGVDIHSRRDIHRILKACADEGMTIILSSSDSEELLEISDRIYVFYEGKVSGMLSGASKNAERLVAYMMGMTATEKQNSIKERA